MAPLDDGDARMLGELDLAIVHALQIDARAPWTRVAAAVGADAATVARHWQALRDESTAWLTAWPTPERWSSSTDVAVVLLDPRTTPDVIDRVSALPWVLSADETSAGCLVLVASSGGLAQLGERVREIAALGARVRRMDVAAAITAEDSGWRLRVLSRQQQRALRDPNRPDEARAPRPDIVAELAEALDEDPRMPAASVAKMLGVSEATARRTVDRAVAAGLLRLGCDVAMPAAGYRRGAVLWARATDAEAAAGHAARLPEAHRVGILVGRAPLFVCVRARSLTALPAIEEAWGDGVEVVDRWTVLRSIKRNGHLLDAEGRSAGRVPLRW
ncbi:AsnC family transcriptional regulator [Microbacterium hydrocarbonoxydans]|uniref:AsnC family transcriptional regulator n=1 Tax=Microbacterium hydrocarbonoxydans TaxID=273678 RepID=UPI000836A114|nr:Lrp/AsnC family transcriptional regulator [Microbacterium hydrocarbonoxydans]